MSIPEVPTIRLDQFLKLQGAADSGGHAKVLVQGGKVKVNGEVDVRRGRKLHIGDVVVVGGVRHAVSEAALRGE